MNNLSEKVISKYLEYGYTQYKMSKFEEYDLYVKNKDFLISDNIITFTDISGKLMALKPDVTLSIIKNSDDDVLSTSKVFYDENVYRVTKDSQGFKEIRQIGLECFGNVDDYCLLEVLKLAAKTLSLISEDYKLDVSNLTIISDILDDCDISTKVRNEILRLMGQKNIHELGAVLTKENVEPKKAELLLELTKTYGDKETVIPKLEALLPGNEGVAQLKELLFALDDNNVQIDFSVVNDVHYYNGIVFNGFVKGVADSVLSGGQYDNLMTRLKRKSKAVGFALYVSMLEDLLFESSEYDVDVVLLYDKGADILALSDAAEALMSEGQTVMVEATLPAKIKAKQVLKFKGKGILENA